MHLDIPRSELINGLYAYDLLWPLSETTVSKTDARGQHCCFRGFSRYTIVSDRSFVTVKLILSSGLKRMLVIIGKFLIENELLKIYNSKYPLLCNLNVLFDNNGYNTGREVDLRTNK